MKYAILYEKRKGGSGILDNRVFDEFELACQYLEVYARNTFGEYYHDYIDKFGGGIDAGELYTEDISLNVIKLN